MTTFVQPQDLFLIRQQRLEAEVLRQQAEAASLRAQLTVTQLYLRLGLKAEDTLDLATGLITPAPVPVPKCKDCGDPFASPLHECAGHAP